METFVYKKEDLHIIPLPWSTDRKEKLSPFDKVLQRTWKAAEKEDLFNYSLNGVKYKSVIGEKDGLAFKCFAVLNTKRVSKRRAPQLFETMNEPFNKELFNFTKVKRGEILFEIEPRLTVKESDGHKSFIVINASPIDQYHMLIVPQMHACQPQHLNADAILLAIDVLQLSSQPSFRVGFNSLHAWASVNHLHLHAMYCESELFIDDFPQGEEIAASIHILDYRAIMPGFVFTIPFDDEDRKKRCVEVQTLLQLFHEENVPYTVVLTRGGSKTRCFVWPRKSSADMENSDVFNLACVEAGGHFSMRSVEEFENLTFEKSVETMQDSKLEVGKFEEIVAKVKHIFRSTDQS